MRRALQTLACATAHSRRSFSQAASAAVSDLSSSKFGFVQHGKHHEALAAGSVGESVDTGKVEIFFALTDKPGALQSVLSLFSKHNMNLSHIQSKPAKTTRSNEFKSSEFRVDVEYTDSNKLLELLNELRSITGKAHLVEPRVVPWFPTKISDIDNFSTKTLDAGAELDSDHPGFRHEDYRTRRKLIVDNASKFRHGEEIPRVSYTKEEVATWGMVYEKLRTLTRKFAVSQYNDVLPLLEKHCGYSTTNIPQLEDISRFLKTQTGFTLRPVGGLLSARDFLNGLAFRVFFSTQYIRHHSKPLYTPEPDICHELMGHAPMFADPEFADFSHEVGLASLGASDEDIKRLATCYWFSVEFGLCMQDGQRKAYGAGLLSSFGELEYACAPYRPAGGEPDFPEYRPWDPYQAAVQPYPITTYQPVYFVADSLSEAKVRMRSFCESLQRGFNVSYDEQSGSVSVDRAIIRGKYQVTMQK